jgi:hypothetical protein
MSAIGSGELGGVIRRSSTPGTQPFYSLVVIANCIYRPACSCQRERYPSWNHLPTTVTNPRPVLLYLESLPRLSEYLSPTSPAPSEFRQMTKNEWGSNNFEESQSSYGTVNGINGHGREEWDLNLQQGPTTELPDAIPMHSTGLVRYFICPLSVPADRRSK